MASPQVENGHTRIANELLEAIACAPLTAREFRVLLAVARETYGWARKAASMRTSRVATLTRMQPTKVARAIRSLRARNLLTNGADGLGLQKDYETWRLAGGSKLDLGPNRTLNRVQVGPSGGSKLDPTERKRKARKKERAPSAPSAHQTLIREYDRLFTAKFDTRPLISGGRDGKIVQGVLRDRTRALGDPARALAEILGLLDGFFRVGTRWVREQGRYDLPAFKASYNELLVMKQRGEL